MIKSQIYLFTKPFLLFVIGTCFPSATKEPQTQSSKSLRCSLVIPVGYVIKKKFRTVDGAANRRSELFEPKTSRSKEKTRQNVAPWSQSQLRTGALQNFPGGPGGCRLKHYSRNIQIISKNYNNLFFDFKSPKNLYLRNRSLPK